MNSANRWMGLFLAVMTCVAGLAHGATTYHWDGEVDTDWGTATNWNPDGNPVAGDTCILDHATKTQVSLSSSTPALAEVEIGAGSTLTFSNWDTLLEATDVTIKNGGIATCVGPFTNSAPATNRVYIQCSNLMIEAGGSIDVNGKGFEGGTGSLLSRMGHGPGGGAGGYDGACYGGGAMHGHGEHRFLTRLYGSAEAPLDPGSGGGSGDGVATRRGGSGGGAVRIVAGHAIINGTITATGGVASGSHASGGSGGAIYLTCTTLAGTNGVMTVDAGAPYSGYGGGAGGGRLAVIYDVAAQSFLPVPGIRFSAASSRCDTTLSAGTNLSGDIGTLYFPDAAFFSPTNLFMGQWVGPCVTHLELSEWVISNVWTRLPPGVSITVTNALTVVGTDPTRDRLELVMTNGETLSCGSLEIDNATLSLGAPSFPVYSWQNDDWNLGQEIVSGPTLDCAGDIVLTNKGCLHVYAGLAHSEADPGYGARVDVEGDIVTYSNCWIYPVSHPTNGATPLFAMNNLRISQGSGIDASNLGFAGANRVWGKDGSLPAYGPGVSTNYWSRGSGHGGLGAGEMGPIYGSSNAPVLPGSGTRCSGNGNSAHHAPFGGGSVQLRVRHTVAMQGDILANVDKSLSYMQAYYRGGGSSGGSIYMTCKTFIGDANATLQASADQGNTYVGYGGGGGRIAVWRVYDKSTGVVSDDVLGGIGLIENGSPGTIVWGWIPPPGTVILIR